MNTIELIKKAMKEKKIIIGQRETLRNVKQGKVSTVIFANNAPKLITQEMENLAGIGKINVLTIKKDNLGLGATCRKQFAIMVVSILT